MAEKFDFRYTDEFDVVAERDEDGDLYVDRGVGVRAVWAILGLAVAGGCAWYALVYDGSEGWLLSTATPLAVGALALAGVLAEVVVGSGRSAVRDGNDGYALEMMVSSRLYVAAAAVAAVTAGVSAFLGVRAPGVVDAGGRRRGLAALAESIPFGEFLLLAAGAAVGAWLLVRALRGTMPVEHKYSFESGRDDAAGS